MEFARISTFAGEEKEKEGVFSSNQRRSNIKTRKVQPKYKHKDEKSARPSRKSQRTKSKSKRTTRKSPSTSKQEKLFFLPPPLHSKIQADFLSKRPHFSRLPPLFLSKAPHPAQNPFHPTRRTRAYAYIRARALSDFSIFAFTLHLTPQQTVDQSIACEGKPCLHLHIHRNNLKNNTLKHTDCQKQVKAKR